MDPEIIQWQAEFKRTTGRDATVTHTKRKGWFEIKSSTWMPSDVWPRKKFVEATLRLKARPTFIQHLP